MPYYRLLSDFCIFLQRKDHARIPLKKAGTFLPAYPTFTMLQSDKLLMARLRRDYFHLFSAVWTHLIIFPIGSPPIKYYFAKCKNWKVSLWINVYCNRHSIYPHCPKLQNSIPPFIHISFPYTIFLRMFCNPPFPNPPYHQKQNSHPPSLPSAPDNR